MNNSLDNLYKIASKQTSPTTLDDFILNQAKQSCQPTITQAKSKKWFYPVATAAVFVMGFTVIFNLQNINQEIQVAPQAYNLDETVEVEFLPESDSLEPHITPSQSSLLKKKRTPLKPKLESAKPINRNELKQDVSAGMSAATPVTAIVPEITGADLGFVESDRNPELNIQDSTKENIAEAQPVLADEIDEQETNAQLDKVVVTGARIRRTNLPSSDELLADIQKLEKLINNKHFPKAKELLIKLKTKYPDYDFTRLEQTLNQ